MQNWRRFTYAAGVSQCFRHPRPNPQNQRNSRHYHADRDRRPIRAQNNGAHMRGTDGRFLSCNGRGDVRPLRLEQSGQHHAEDNRGHREVGDGHPDNCVKFSVHYIKFSVYYVKFSVYYVKFSVYYVKFSVYYVKFSVDVLERLGQVCPLRIAVGRRRVDCSAHLCCQSYHECRGWEAERAPCYSAINSDQTLQARLLLSARC